MNKARGRPFAPGNKLGRGRPQGSRNKPKSPEQALLDEYAPHLIRKCMTMAMQGDRSAMRLCMERILPRRPDARMRMNLRPIRKAQDVDQAAEKVMQAVLHGDLTPVEGARMMSILVDRSRIIEKVQLESEKLEEHIAANKQEQRDPEIAALTDDELAQLIVIAQKIEDRRASRADAPLA
jgi:hypothetical protein